MFNKVACSLNYREKCGGHFAPLEDQMKKITLKNRFGETETFAANEGLPVSAGIFRRWGSRAVVWRLVEGSGAFRLKRWMQPKDLLWAVGDFDPAFADSDAWEIIDAIGWGGRR
jgi:hypothetical protein